MADTDIKEPAALRFESPDRENLEKANQGVVHPVDEDEEFSYAEQRKIIHRIDRRLVVMLGLMYCVSLIDRGNMPNAAVAGMHDDLNTDVGYRYSIATLVFFITYTESKVRGKTLAGSQRRSAPVGGVSSLREPPFEGRFPELLPSSSYPFNSETISSP